MMTHFRPVVRFRLPIPVCLRIPAPLPRTYPPRIFPIFPAFPLDGQPKQKFSAGVRLNCDFYGTSIVVIVLRRPKPLSFIDFNGRDLLSDCPQSIVRGNWPGLGIQDSGCGCRDSRLPAHKVPSTPFDLTTRFVFPFCAPHHFISRALSTSFSLSGGH